MQKTTVAILVLCVIFLFLGLMPVHGENEIYESVVRLHVLANSDSEEDQALKLKVRDAILSEGEDIFTDCKSKDEAVAYIEENKDRLTNIARTVIENEGYSYSVSIEIGEEEYPTRSYESVCFPAGSYTSLRVIIGEGEGQNWWCVLYPPMCLSAATGSNAEDAFISVGLNKDQYGIITETNSPTYKARFKILEVIDRTIRG